MKRLSWAVFAFVCAGTTGCGLDCAPSSAIQLTLVPESGVDGARISKLRVGMSINGGPQKSVDVTPARALTTPGALLLQPDPTPPADSYSIMVTVQGLAANGTLVAIGSTAGDVSALGCNRLEARLTPLPGGNTDAGGALDGPHAPADMSLPPSQPDLSSCTSTLPDEDSDGRGDACDLCPADFDSTPSDGDADGLPDACDPDPTRPGNQLLYFEPFNSDNKHWMGKVEPGRSDLLLDTQGPGTMVAGNQIDSFPLNVRVQTTIFVDSFYIGSMGIDADAGIYLGSSGNINSGTGILCSMNTNRSSGDSLDLNVISNGSAGPPISVPFTFSKDQSYQLRLTQRGSTYVCEASANNLLTKTVMGTVNQAPTGPLFMALHGSGILAEVHSVVAESVLP